MFSNQLGLDAIYARFPFAKPSMKTQYTKSLQSSSAKHKLNLENEDTTRKLTKKNNFTRQKNPVDQSIHATTLVLSFM